MKPLLLTEGSGDLVQQVFEAECRAFHSTVVLMQEWDHQREMVQVAWVDPNFARSPLPTRLRWHNGVPIPKVGCIEVVNATPRDFERGDWDHKKSHFVFRDRDGFRRAWRMARRLFRATSRTPAQIHPAEMGDAFLLCAHAHRRLLRVGGAR